ncbi:hypothetical protein Ancab_039851 [Ancistrocladus abbreviatus]
MEVEKVLRMREGTRKASYANNSQYQGRAIANTRTILEESIQELYHAKLPECLMIADLGCSAGPNALKVLLDMIDFVDIACRSLNHKLPEFQVFLNDLPGNDFNTMFRLLPSFWENLKEKKGSDFEVACFVSGTPGSFYERLFTNNFLHFVYSSYSLHWLSQVPKGLVGDNGKHLNKGNIYISKTSPPEVGKAYQDQFERDFTLFLRLRLQELIPGGRMVLIMLATSESREASIFWELLSMAMRDMVSEGLIEEEKLDAFNLPLYRASAGEVKELVEREGSLTLHHLHTWTSKWDNPKLLANTIRAIVEPMLASEFGEAIIDDLFCRFQEMIRNFIAMDNLESRTLIISLSKKA